MAMLPVELFKQFASRTYNNTTTICSFIADEQSGSFAAAKVFFESSVLLGAGE